MSKPEPIGGSIAPAVVAELLVVIGIIVIAALIVNFGNLTGPDWF